MDLRAAALSTLLSVGAHGVIGWAAMSARPGMGEHRVTEATTVTLEVEAPPTPEPTAPEPPPEPPPAEPPAEPQEVRNRAVRPRSPRPAPPAPEPEPDAPAPLSPEERARAEERKKREEGDAPSTMELPPDDLSARLDPARVARDAVGIGSPSSPLPDAPSNDAEARGRALSESLRQEANAKPWVTRTKPDLEPGPGGTFQYDGHVFDAEIQPDGTVRFADGTEQKRELGKGSMASGRFDLGNALMRRRGEDPHAAERAWFLRETKELRDRLARKHREEEVGRGLRGLRGRLWRIWDGSEPGRARRRRIFELWDECSEDEMGEVARDTIVGFVRKHLPSGSPDAFSADELRRLNEQRQSRARFEPYGK